MGRLIREDDVMRMLTGVELNNGTITDAKIELRNVKTAYDVEKVVAELEERIDKVLSEEGMNNYCYASGMCEALEIARKGGVE